MGVTVCSCSGRIVAATLVVVLSVLVRIVLLDTEVAEKQKRDPAHHLSGLISGYLEGGREEVPQQEFLELICLAFTLKLSIATMELFPSLKNSPTFC